MHICAIILYILVFVAGSHSAKILCVFSTPSLSHLAVFQTVSKELSLRGHQVTVISSRPLRDEKLTNLTEIEMSSLYDIVAQHRDKTKSMSKNNFLAVSLFYAGEYYFKFVEEILGHLDTIFPDQNENFDLLIVENLSPLIYSLTCRFKTKIIGFSSNLILSYDHQNMGNPTHSVLYPDLSSKITKEDFSFFENVASYINTILLRLSYYIRYMYKVNSKAREFFGAQCPSFLEITKNISLLITNTNILLHKSRPLVPHVIETGGFLPEPQKTVLPTQIQQFLDASTDGAIYLSLGSSTDTSLLPMELQKILLQALGEVPFRVLMKWHTTENLAQNILAQKWLPQISVLGHKNIKAFIHHSGLLSVEESISAAVPIIALPLALDQPSLARRVAQMEIGLSVDHATVTVEGLKKIIVEVAQNRSYKDNILRIRDVMKDQSLRSLEKSIWWIEYVLRRKNVDHLKSVLSLGSFYEENGLDLVAIVVLMVFSFGFVVKRLIRWIFLN